MHTAYVTEGARVLKATATASPVLNDGDVRLKVRAVGICGSDHHIYLGEHSYVKYPTIQGHEFVGEVVEFGPGCTGSIPLGSLVVVEPLVSCGHCYACGLGRYNCCSNLQVIGVHRPGAFQSEVVVPESSMHLMPDVEPEIAVFAEPISIGIQAVRRGRIGLDDFVLILGAGPIGLASVMACKQVGAKVAVVDLIEQRLDKARVLGADLTLVANSDSEKLIRDWSSGGVTVVLDAVAAVPAIELGMKVIRTAGRFVLVGMTTKNLPLPIGDIVAKELDIIASRNSANVFPDAIKLMIEYKDEIRNLVQVSRGLDTLPAMMEFTVNNPQDIEKVVISLN